MSPGKSFKRVGLPLFCWTIRQWAERPFCRLATRCFKFSLRQASLLWVGVSFCIVMLFKFSSVQDGNYKLLT